MLKRNVALYLGLVLISLNIGAMQIPLRFGPCASGSAPCLCMQADKFLVFKTASHGAPVKAVSWCCLPTLNGLGNPSIHLAIAGDAVLTPVIPGEAATVPILIRIYELDLYALTFKELNSYYVNDALLGVANNAVVNTLDWCCSNDAYYLVAGGSDLDDAGDDVVVFEFDNASWLVTGTVRVPFAAGGTVQPAFCTYGANVYSVATLCNPCADGSVAFYLAIGGDTTSVSPKRQVTIVPFINDIIEFDTTCSINIATNLTSVYSVDWCYLGASTQPVLAVGGAMSNQGLCQGGGNILVYGFDGICQYPVCPVASLLTSGAFYSNVVDSVRWCCNASLTCPIFPYLAVGGDVSDAGINAAIYAINPNNYSMSSIAYVSTSSLLSSINAVDWNPAPCKCTNITIGGCQSDCPNPVCNVIAYNRLRGTVQMNLLTETLFDSNVLSLEWCKTTTIPANYCAYLAVGTTGTEPCAGGSDETDQLVIYQATFCKNPVPVSPCQRSQ